MTTPDADKIAEAMARRCAERIHSHYNEEWFNNIPVERRENYRGMYERESLKREIISKNILQGLPLTQLVKVAIAAMDYTTERGYQNVSSCRQDQDRLEKVLMDSISTLKEQMPELFE